MTIRKLGISSSPEFLGRRYGQNARWFGAFTQVVESIIFLAVQLVVSSLTISVLFDIPTVVATVLMAAVMIVSNMLGGLFAVVWVDVYQYIILIIGVIVAAFSALWKVGGFGVLTANLDPAFFRFSELGTMEPLAWVALCFYSYGTDQGYLQKVFAAKDTSIARFAYLFTGLNYLIFGSCIALLGICTRVLVPGLANTDEALPMLIVHVLPPGLKAFFLTAIIATAMSTYLSWLSAGTSIFVGDMYLPSLAKKPNDKVVLLISRITTVLLGLASLGVAFVFTGVIDAVVFSTIVGPASTFFPVVLGIYCKWIARETGFLSILIAAVVGVCSHLFIYSKTTGLLGQIHPLFLGPLAGILILVVGSVLMNWFRNRK